MAMYSTSSLSMKHGKHVGGLKVKLQDCCHSVSPVSHFGHFMGVCISILPPSAVPIHNAVAMKSDRNDDDPRGFSPVRTRRASAA